MNHHEIIDYWFSAQVKNQWFSSTPELDAEIRRKYETVWERAVKGELNEWQNDALGSLALVLIFDQFPLNMFRGEAKSFKTERAAIDVARASISNSFIPQFNEEQLSFLFMPFMHSEKIEDQDFAVELFRENKLEGNLKFAKHHRDIVRTFGRFPHRNKILGRKSSVEELEYLGGKGAFKG